MRGLWKYIIIGALLIIAQGVLDNYVNLSIYIDLSLFMFILLVLPARAATVTVMLVAFATGLVVDILGNGIPGLTSAALTAAGLCRRAILSLTVPKDPSSMDGKSSIEDLGIIRFAVYAAAMSFIFLSVYILLDTAGFRPFGQCAARLLISLVINTALLTVIFAVTGDNRKW